MRVQRCWHKSPADSSCQNSLVFFKSNWALTSEPWETVLTKISQWFLASLALSSFDPIRQVKRVDRLPNDVGTLSAFNYLGAEWEIRANDIARTRWIGVLYCGHDAHKRCSPPHVTAWWSHTNPTWRGSPGFRMEEYLWFIASSLPKAGSTPRQRALVYYCYFQLVLSSVIISRWCVDVQMASVRCWLNW